MKRLLVACEFSGIIRDAFAARGWDAWSCDLLPCDNPKHICGDVMQMLDNEWDEIGDGDWNEDEEWEDEGMIRQGYSPRSYSPPSEGRRHLRLVSPSQGWKDRLVSLRGALQAQQEEEKNRWRKHQRLNQNRNIWLFLFYLDGFYLRNGCLHLVLVSTTNKNTSYKGGNCYNNV